MNIRRVVKRSGEELRATAKIARLEGLSGAWSTLKGKIEIQRMCRDGYREGPKRTAVLLRKHEVMLSYFEKMFKDFIDSYDHQAPLPEDDPSMRGKIWVCWWQGLDNAPDIVKACVRSIRKHSCGHEVIVLNESNYLEYASMPDWVVDKYRSGVISKTNFSDLLRFTLLSQHGGVWLDATIFVTSPLSEDWFKKDFYTVSRPDCDHMSIAAGYFSDFAMGCSYDNRRVFVFIRDLFLQYWRLNDSLIDYLTNDYIIVLARNHFKEVQEAFASVKPSNPHLGALLLQLSEPFDPNTWKQITTDTSLFKLSWKYNQKLISNGSDTFYSKIIANAL